jgi:uncharacterized membrane protein YhfC
MSVPHIGAGWIASEAITIAFAILFPVVLAIVLERRLHVPHGWRYIGLGALIFVLFQVISRVPAIEVAQAILAPQLKASAPLLWTWLVILALTAGLFEEVGRYVGYRWFMRHEEKTWSKAILYGAGHGGIESILLVGFLGALTLTNVLLLPTIDLSQLSPDQRKSIVDQFGAVAAQPGWLPLLGAYERICGITFHIAMSVVVLQVFRRGQIRWLWIAVAAHALYDFVAVAIGQALPALGVHDVVVTDLTAEAAVTVGAAIALWAIFALRDGSGGAQSGDAVAPALDALPGSSAGEQSAEPSM